MRARVGLIALWVGVWCGCGGSSSSSGNLRFVQASATAPFVDLYVNGKLQSSNLGYPNATGYFPINSGAHIQVLPSNSGKAVLDTKIPITASANETLILTGPFSKPSTTLLTDGGNTAASGDANVRVVNASIGMGTPDVYIVPSGTSISGALPTTGNLGFDSSTGYVIIPAGSYDVFFTQTGTKNAFLDTGPINLSAAGSETVIGLDGPGGTGFTFTALTDQ